MITKRAEIVAITIVVAMAITSLASFENNTVYAESSYKMAGDVTAILTFTFKDGVEVHEFPVFKMGDDYLDNRASDFEVQGVLLNDAPHLFQAMDDAFKYRTMAKTKLFDYDYRFFDVDVAFVKSDKVVRNLYYNDCQINDYKVETVLDSYEGYVSTKSGFAIINDIKFDCKGVETQKIFKTDTLNKVRTMYEGGTSSTDTVLDEGISGFEYTRGIRTFVTFDFDHGTEKIEFPVFKITAGFNEADSNKINTNISSFEGEAVVADHPMLQIAIDKARDVSKAINTVYNNDFQAKVQFIQGTLMGGEQLLREINYVDCRLNEATITTESDKEEGWTGKSGFAIVDKIIVECAGQEPVNPNYSKIFDGVPIWQTSTGVTPIVREHLENSYNMGTGPRAVATFSFDDNTKEVIDFPIYNQGKVLGKNFPTFELQGLVGDYPFLYKRVDKNAQFTSISGTNQGTETFDVDVNLMFDGKSVRGYKYTDCRVTNYNVETNQNKEEGFFKGFALENSFEFECFGYQPANPVYQAMFDIYDKADTLSSTDLRETQTWSDVYKYYQ